ncbi:hypothetical protein HBI56_119210 [Parastagonospora nodorum]|nr:hypothetical protein HBH50_135700 [Parastagonospora nodorum]KAH4085232.1 hypothetical protein HBH48_158260 [Parastagonospora nodorum]KAH4193147.1 hypothetical protein HBI95_204430 [Parastagonospora nodorum]KAH4220677.1 hypothetical protein HBI06_169330 [Parastagonospora nodorum]KAH4237468.1 hypothetical protein HBI05_131770 [Parastagonospora nodorum]
MLRPIRYEDDHARGGSGAYAPILKLADWGRANVNALTGHDSCLYLDLLAWFTGGKAGYKDFGEARKASPTPWTKTRASTLKS